MSKHLENRTAENVAVRDSGSFDLESLLERCMNETRIVRLILSKFAEEASNQLNLLEEQIAEGRTERIMEIAHGLKGAAGVAALQQFGLLSSELETLGKNKQMQQLRECANLLRQEFGRCMEQISKALATLDAKSSEKPGPPS